MSQVDVTIMGQAYKLACKEGEQNTLIQAAAYLDEKMCDFRDAAKIKGTDRIAVMAALAISAELLATKVSGVAVAEMKRQLHTMNEVLDEALATQENLS